MSTAAARGAYYLRRTHAWLLREGYAVAWLERVRWVYRQERWLPMRRVDQLGGDLLAMRIDHTLVVQVKSGVSWRGSLASARREFAKYPLAPGCEQWILAWVPQARQPVIEVVARGPQRADHPVEKRVRKKPKVLPLFQAGGR